MRSEKALNKILVAPNYIILMINTGPTDCHASGAGAPYKLFHFLYLSIILIAHNLNGHKGAFKQFNTSELKMNKKWNRKTCKFSEWKNRSMKNMATAQVSILRCIPNITY